MLFRSMNPVFEVFAAFLIWADPTATAHWPPEEILGVQGSRIVSRMSRFLPSGATRLCSGTVDLMLFESDSWEEARERLNETSPNLWREAISPPGASPERILHAISSPAGGFQLIADLGLRPDPGLGALYSALLAHPRTLKQDILTILDDAWSTGFRQWWSQVKPAERAVGAPGDSPAATTGLQAGRDGGRRAWIMTASPQILAGGEVRIPLRNGTLILVPPPVVNVGPAPEERTPARTPVAVTRGQAIRAAVAARRAPGGLHGAAPRTAAQQTPQAKSAVRPLAIDEGVFRGLADGTRLQVLAILQQGSSYPSVMAEQLGVSLPTMSHHISSLKAAGLISVKKQKGYAELSLCHEALERTIDYLKALVAEAPTER